LLFLFGITIIAEVGLLCQLDSGHVRAMSTGDQKQIERLGTPMQAGREAFEAVFEGRKPPLNARRAVIEILRSATAALVASGTASRALKAGDIAPSFVLTDADSNPVRSESLLLAGPLVIQFFRGGWCPYCNTELQALQTALSGFRKLGATLVAVSPQNTAHNRKSARDNKLGFPILSDPRNSIAAAFGVRFELPDELIALYRGIDTDLPAINGDNSWTLPMPARFVIGRDRLIRYAEINPDYTRRPNPEDLVPVLRSLNARTVQWEAPDIRRTQRTSARVAVRPSQRTPISPTSRRNPC